MGLVGYRWVLGGSCREVKAVEARQWDCDKTRRQGKHCSSACPILFFFLRGKKKRTASVIQAVPRLDFGSCLWPDLVHFRAQASIWKDGFNQRAFIAFRCGLGCKAEAVLGKQFLSKQPRARRYSRIQQLSTSASPWPLPGF